MVKRKFINEGVAGIYKIRILLAAVVLLLSITAGCKKDETPNDPVLNIETNKITSRFVGGFGNQNVTDNDHVLICSYNSVHIFKFNSQGIELIQTIDFTTSSTILKMETDNSTLAIGIDQYDGYKVFIYHRTADSWTFKQEITGKGTGDLFGITIDIDGDYMVIGAPGLKSYGTGITEGRMYIYRKTNEEWIKEHEFSAEEPLAGDEFGRAVAIHNDMIVAGSDWVYAHIYKNEDPWLLSRVDTIVVSAIFHSDSSFMYFDPGLNLRSFTLESDGNFMFRPIESNFLSAILRAFEISENYALAAGNFNNKCYLLKYGNNQWAVEKEFKPDSGESCSFYGLAFTGDYVILGGESLDISGTSYVYFRKYK